VNSWLDRRFVDMNRICEAGFPDDVWPVAFVAGCNLRCPYCLNASIANPKSETKFIPFEEVVARLDEWGEDGVVISGGEPCMPHPEGTIIDLARALADAGKKTGVSTNGTYPSILADLTNNKLVSFVGLDCKFAPNVGSPSTIVNKLSPMAGDADPVAVNYAVQGSLTVLKQWHSFDPDARSEVRTTLYPPIVGEDDLKAIGWKIHPRSRWVLQQYRPNTMFDGRRNEVEPYSEDEAARLLAVARGSCEAKVEMRWP